MTTQYFTNQQIEARALKAHAGHELQSESGEVCGYKLELITLKCLDCKKVLGSFQTKREKVLNGN